MFFIALFSASADTQQAANAEIHALQATKQVRAGNILEAESELRKAVRLAPDNMLFLASLGTVLAMEKKFSESNAIFKKVLSKQPDDTTVRRYLAANLWQMHNYPEARRNLELLLKQTPTDKESLLLLGMVAENMKDYAKAAEALASVPELTERRPESIAALAESYYHIGKAANAQAALNKMAGFPDSHSMLLGAQVADAAGDYETAEHMLASIAPDDANHTVIEYRIALARFHAKKFALSRDALLTLIQQNAGGSEIYNLLGWCYYNQAEPNKAVQTFERAIELFPSDEANYLDLIKMHMANRSFAAALRVAKNATAAFPNSVKAFESRGSAERKLEQFRPSVDSFTEAHRLDPSWPDALLGLAQSESSAGMVEESATNFQLGIKRFPRDLRFKVQYASSLLKQAEGGDATAEIKAQILLKSALAADDSLANAHYQLGNLALRKGETSQARGHLEKAEKLAPNSSEVHFALANVYRRLGRKDRAAHEMEMFKNLTSASEVGATPQSPGEKPD
jgi:Tfp pilus assembly protein PilF